MTATLVRADRVPVLWRVLPGVTRYGDAIAAMQRHAEALAAGANRESVWLLSSPPGYNPGIKSRPADLPPAATLNAQGLEVDAPAGPPRAGDWTYHGPGVRGVIVMLDLRKRRMDIAGFVDALHRWIIAAVAEFGISSRREDFDPAGVWVNGGVDKIASIGLRLSRWVTSYGFALYLNPALANFAPIKPCGIDIPGKGITSLDQLGVKASMDDVDAALRKTFEPIFGATSLVQ